MDNAEFSYLQELPGNQGKNITPGSQEHLDNYTFERVEDGDPNRCQAVKPSRGQCNNKAVDGSRYCLAHGGNKAIEANRKTGLRNLLLTRYRAAVERLVDSDHLVSLRDEIGVLRLLLQTKLELCQSETDLALESAPIGDIIVKIEKLVKSCSILEERADLLLTKQQVLGFASKVVGIISEEINDPEVVDRIANRIIVTIAQPGSTE